MSYNNDKVLPNVLKGTLIAVLFVLSGILVFAISIRLFSLSTSVIKPVNQLIKVLSVFFGVILCTHGDKGLIKGLITGVCSVVMTYMLFSLMGGEKLLSAAFFLDVVFGAVAGAVSGVMAVNLKKSKG